MSSKKSEKILGLFNHPDDSPTPLYSQFLAQLRGLINDGSLEPGTKLPSERQFCQYLSISRNTLRQAISKAENEGLIEPVMGLGTFVAANVPTEKTRKKLKGQAPVNPENIPPEPETKTEVLNLGKAAGFVLSNPGDHAQNAVLNSAMDALAEAGYGVLPLSSGGNFTRERRFLEDMVDNGLNGLIVWPSTDSEEQTEFYRKWLASSSIPLVFVDQLPAQVEGPLLASSDHPGAGAIAARHLIERGHRLIHFVCRHRNPMQRGSVEERYKGFQAELNKMNLDLTEPLLLDTGHGELSFQRVWKIADERRDILRKINNLLKKAIRAGVNSMVFESDALALLSLIALKESHLHPEVVGFGGSPLARAGLFHSVAENYSRIGEQAAAFLLHKMNGEPPPPRDRLEVWLQPPYWG